MLVKIYKYVKMIFVYNKERGKYIRYDLLLSTYMGISLVLCLNMNEENT